IVEHNIKIYLDLYKKFMSTIMDMSNKEGYYLDNELGSHISDMISTHVEKEEALDFLYQHTSKIGIDIFSKAVGLQAINDYMITDVDIVYLVENNVKSWLRDYKINKINET